MAKESAPGGKEGSRQVLRGPENSAGSAWPCAKGQGSCQARERVLWVMGQAGAQMLKWKEIPTGLCGGQAAQAHSSRGRACGEGEGRQDPPCEHAGQDSVRCAP